MIKMFKDWLVENESDSYSYGCAMVYFSNPEMVKIQDTLDIKDIYEEDGDRTFGIEDAPHVTLLYGLHSNEIKDSDVIKTITDIEMQNIKLFNISLFKSKNYEVLKYDADGDFLHEINGALIDAFPYTSDFPDYHPHSTIAYLKTGTGDKYVEKFKNISTIVTPDKIVYSKPDGTKVTKKI